MYLIISSARPSRILDLTFGQRDRRQPFALKSSFPFWSSISAQYEKRDTTKVSGQEHNLCSGEDNMMVSLLLQEPMDTESFGRSDEELVDSFEEVAGSAE